MSAEALPPDALDALEEDEADVFTLPLPAGSTPVRRARPSFDTRAELIAHLLAGGELPVAMDFEGLPVRRVAALPTDREGEVWLTGLDADPDRSQRPTLRRTD
ncbi:hypothetical protein GCM10009737_28250 [Nocardioides lentus]|uniref:SseB protein N-terminal domain-containing protein n=1 Tax=Nocardioides lentus TaxID=338077 RepID=A0ABN2PLJ3_9ACTN